MTETRVMIFHADWCGPCSTFEKRLEDFGFEDEVDVPVEHYDVDTDDGQRIAAEYNVRSLPTTVVEKGSTISSFVGITDPSEIVDEVER